MNNKMDYMNRQEGKVQRSLGLAKRYLVRACILQNNVFVIVVQEDIITALNEEDAIESFQSTFSKEMVALSLKEKLVYEVKEVQDDTR